MAAIESVFAHQILDSRGNPTIEVILQTDDGAQGHGLVPSGASTGELEAVELRDGDPHKWNGKGVSKAIANVNDIIAPAIQGMDATDQRALDEFLIELDGTPNKGKLGANAILGVSLAALYASAESADLPVYRYIGGTNAYVLPVANFNIINGGAHAPANNIDIQEFMLSPYGFETFSESLRAAAEIYHTLKSILLKRGLDIAVGDEGGFAPNLNSNIEAFDLIMDAIEKAGYEPGKQVGFCIDPAATTFYDKEKGLYHFDGEFRDSDWMIDYYEDLVKKYPLLSIEDPFEDNDWDAFIKIMDRLGDTIQIMGDDLVVTNPKLIQKAIDKHALNSVLIKLNQIGTLSETLDAIELATHNCCTAMVSHRSGETVDTTLADLTVAKNTGQVKSGAPARAERLAKYNRFCEIEDELGSAAKFIGPHAFKRAEVLARA